MFGFAYLLAISILFSSYVFADVPLCTDLNIAITETYVDSSVYYLSWWGIGNKVVYAMTQNYGLFRSVDEGRTWVDQSPLLQNNYVRWMVPTADVNKFYLLGFGPDFPLWTTSDSGSSYQFIGNATNYLNGYAIHSIAPHPQKSDWAIAGGWTQRCFSSSARGDCHFDLHFTTDFGASWHLIDSYILQFTWGSTLLGSSDNFMSYLYTTYDDKTGDQTAKSYDNAVLKRGEFLTENIDTVYPQVNAIFKSQNNRSILFLAEKNTQGGVSLLVSENDGISWVRGRFPMDIPENSYSILDDSDGGVFVNVQHDNLANYGNVYAGNAYGGFYTLALKYNRRGASTLPFWGGCDFIKLSDIDGVYVANYYDAPGDITPDALLKTGITWDMGGFWSPLTPPSYDSNGNTIQPCAGCSLQLFGPLEFVYGRFYSAPGAIGIMMSQGNIGTTLSIRADEINTYFSRDAGVNWFEIAKGSYSYEIGDMGGLLILAEQQSATSNVLFSWNEGLNFTQCKFTVNGDVNVDNIVVDPNWTSEKFILYGNRQGDSRGLIVQVDFSNFHERSCTGMENPGTPQSDYEYWTPAPAGNGCLLGKTTQYVRRKRERECYNPESFKPVVITQHCACTRQDYICDYCFEFDSNTNNCTLACSNYDPYQAPEGCKDTFLASRGYRLIPGDTCDISNGLDLLPETVICEAGTHHGKVGAGTLALIMLIMVIIAVALIIVAVLYTVKKTKKPESLYAFVQKLSSWSSSGKSGRSGQSYARLNMDEGEEEGRSTSFLANDDDS